MEHFNYNFYKKNFNILSNDFFTLIHFMIMLKKILPKNILLNFKIKKN